MTIGVGYDLGRQAPTANWRDWGGLLADVDIGRLASVSGLADTLAKAALTRVSSVVVPFAAARTVFYLHSLPEYAAMTCRAYPRVENLPADAQAAVLSLVYNRGVAMDGERRREMRALRPLIAARDFAGIAAELRSMKRLWDPQALPGLVDRREKEAQLVEHSQRDYLPSELARVCARLQSTPRR